MNFKELRIGNWVEDEDDSHDRWQVERIEPGKEETKGMWFVNGRWTEDLQPIPLTPEILEKAGFMESQDNTYYLPKMDYTVDFVGVILWKKEYFRLNEEFTSVGKPIQYLHQMQNLFFALTGEELNIEL
jgi:hypothetical protein